MTECSEGSDGQPREANIPVLPVDELRAGAPWSRVILEHLSQAVFLKDRNLCLVEVNPGFCAAAGRGREELLGRDDSGLYPCDFADRYRAEERRILADGEGREGFEERILAGQARTVQIVRSPVPGPDGRVAGVLGIFWDVTDRRRQEERARQAQKMETVGQLAGGIAHDFNNLLTGVLNNLALVRTGLADAVGLPRVLEHLDNAEEISRRAADLTRQLLGFARRMEGQPELLDLNCTVREAVRLVRPSLGGQIAVDVALAPRLWPVRADASQLTRALLNLCLNARDAMPHGGVLAVETGNVTLTEQAAGEHLDGQPGDFAVVRVTDTGEGIAADLLPRLFEPFFTTRDFGRGVGLALVFGIVKEHQGWVHCASEMGRGSRFEVYLPRCPEDVAAAGGGVAVARDAGETIRASGAL
ncbi:MAG: PAS domain-containing protein [Gemmataceae bacterium]|nr:PAS domain-containing protein [Gemmataceae bacterium]